MMMSRPAGDPDGVELGAEGVSVAVGVPVELVVVLELGLDLLAARVVRVHVQLVGHLARRGRGGSVCARLNYMLNAGCIIVTPRKCPP